MSKCTITEIVPLNKKNGSPILAHFQNGDIRPEGAADMKCFMATKKTADTDSTSNLALAVTNNNVYAGTINEGFPTDLVRTLIGIRNKKTNKIKLIEVEECSMLSKYFDEIPKVLDRPSTVKDPKRMLAKHFGSKKSNINLERMERMKINVDVVRDQLDETVSAMVEKDENELDAFDQEKLDREQFLLAMVPPLNQEATALSEIYDLYKIIDESLMSRLSVEALQILKTNLKDLPIEPQFLLDHIRNAQQSKEPDSPVNLNKIKICIYIDALATFIKKLKQRLNMKREEISQITTKIETDIRTKFANPNSVKLMRSNYISNKAIAYLTVLSLLISDKYEMDLNDIIQATSTQRAELLKLYAILPIRLIASKDKVTDKLTLKLPKNVKSALAPQLARKRKAQ